MSDWFGAVLLPAAKKRQRPKECIFAVADAANGYAQMDALLCLAASLAWWSVVAKNGILSRLLQVDCHALGMVIFLLLSADCAAAQTRLRCRDTRGVALWGRGMHGTCLSNIGRLMQADELRTVGPHKRAGCTLVVNKTLVDLDADKIYFNTSSR